MTYLISVTNRECSLNFNDEDGLTYKGNIKDVALMFARHVYNNYNGYTHYLINDTLNVKYSDGNFILSWIESPKRGYVPAPEWWLDFKNEFDKIMKMKAFM